MDNYSSLIDILPRLLQIGCRISHQDGEWWIFKRDGEGIVGGKTFREMCDKICTVDIEDYERQHINRYK